MSTATGSLNPLLPQGRPLLIVRLDGIHAPSPTFNLPVPHEYIEHPSTDPSDVAGRIKDADIVIVTRVTMSASDLSASTCPNLKLIAVMAIGTDMIDISACTARGIMICNVPAASNEAVAEHAFALFLAARRRVVQLHALTLESKMWPEKHSCKSVFGGVPTGWRDEVVGVVGVGELGNRVANIARAMGMTVLLAERKGTEAVKVRAGRTAFTEVLSQCTALILTSPLTDETRHMISFPELNVMRRDSLIINVARGPIVVDEALVKALKEGWIGGAAVDVYPEEPGSRENSLLIREGGSEGLENLILSPHLAWFARSSLEKLKRTVSETVLAWVLGKPVNIVFG